MATTPTVGTEFRKIPPEEIERVMEEARKWREAMRARFEAIEGLPPEKLRMRVR